MRLFLLSLCFFISLGGCASVKPWQKARLAEPHMQFKQTQRGQFFLDHTVITVEQAEGGNGKSGGGCGCR